MKRAALAVLSGVGALALCGGCDGRPAAGEEGGPAYAFAPDAARSRSPWGEDAGPALRDAPPPSVLLDVSAVSDLAEAPEAADAPDAAEAPEAAEAADVAEPGEPDVTPPPTGSWGAPIQIPALPFTHSADTSAAPSDSASAYAPCAPSIDEPGGEVVYRLDLDEAATLSILVDDLPGDLVDADVHVLEAPTPDACIARDNVEVVIELAPGTWWIAVDTWAGPDGVPLAGPYTLSVGPWSDPGPDTGSDTGPDTGSDTGPTDCLASPIECSEGDLPSPNGVPSEPPGIGGCPPGMTPIEAWCVDRWEAALVRVEPDGSPAPWSPYAHPSTQTVRAVSAPGLVPQGYVDQVTAAAACAQAGKRLCTDTEWLRACRGPDQTTYPYGGVLVSGLCNDARACHPVVQLFETAADWIWSQLGHPCINQLPDGLAATGAHAGCVSAEGALDMMGNLHEWTAAASGTFRGGFYVDTVINGAGCLYATTAHNVWHWDYSTGFRCCWSP